MFKWEENSNPYLEHKGLETEEVEKNRAEKVAEKEAKAFTPRASWDVVWWFAVMGIFVY